MKNVKELRNELASLYSEIKAGRVDRKVATELTNVAGKMIDSAMVQVHYYRHRKESSNIEFLNEN